MDAGTGRRSRCAVRVLPPRQEARRLLRRLPGAGLVLVRGVPPYRAGSAGADRRAVGDALENWQRGCVARTAGRRLQRWSRLRGRGSGESRRIRISSMVEMILQLAAVKKGMAFCPSLQSRCQSARHRDLHAKSQREVAIGSKALEKAGSVATRDSCCRVTRYVSHKSSAG